MFLYKHKKYQFRSTVICVTGSIQTSRIVITLVIFFSKVAVYEMKTNSMGCKQKQVM